MYSRVSVAVVSQSVATSMCPTLMVSPRSACQGPPSPLPANPARVGVMAWFRWVSRGLADRGW